MIFYRAPLVKINTLLKMISPDLEHNNQIYHDVWTSQVFGNEVSESIAKHRHATT